VVISGGPLFALRGAELVALAERRALPAVLCRRGSCRLGGPDELWRLGSRYVSAARHLGRKDSQGRQTRGYAGCSKPTKITLKVNLKTANSLGLKVPESILVRADEVIE